MADETPTRPAAPVKGTGLPVALTPAVGLGATSVLARVVGLTLLAPAATEVPVRAAEVELGAPAASMTFDADPGALCVTSWTCGTVYSLSFTVMVVAGYEKGVATWLGAEKVAAVVATTPSAVLLLLPPTGAATDVLEA